MTKVFGKNYVDLYDGLYALMDLQSGPLAQLGHSEPTKELMSVYGQALSIEVSEFLNELNWKPWKHKEADLDKVTEEFVDVLHFVGSWLNLLNAMGITPKILVDVFSAKHAVNAARLNGEVEHYGADVPDVFEITDTVEITDVIGNIESLQVSNPGLTFDQIFPPSPRIRDYSQVNLNGEVR